MTQIDKYENQRTIVCLIISIATIISAGYSSNLIKNDILAVIVMFAIVFAGCFLINLAWKICNKKIEKYKKDNAEQLSLDSSQL